LTITPTQCQRRFALKPLAAIGLCHVGLGADRPFGVEPFSS